jgi:hypothetical protein
MNPCPAEILHDRFDTPLRPQKREFDKTLSAFSVLKAVATSTQP